MVLRASDIHTLMKSLVAFCLLSVSYQRCFLYDWTQACLSIFFGIQFTSPS